MDNLDTIRLNEIASISTGGDVPKEAFSKNKTPEYDVPIISNGVGNEAIYGYTNIKKISKPCITIAARGTIGYTAFRNEPFYPIIRLICIVPKQEKVIPKYLYYYLSNTRFAGTIAGISQLTVPMISRYKIKLPDLETQQKIAQILDTINAEITLTKNLIQSEKKTFSGLLQIVSKIPNSDLRQLGDIAIIKKGAQLNKENLLARGIPVINGGIEPSGYTNDSNTEANTITISEGGNSCGFVSFQTEPFWSGGHCYTIKPNKINKKLLYFILKDNERRIKRLRVGSGLPNIQKEDLKKIKINIPSSNEHEKIVTLLNTSEDKINVLNIILEKELLIYRCLLNHLISGDFVLTNIKLENGKE